MIQTQRNLFWEQYAREHADVRHGATDGKRTRNSILTDYAGELESTEFTGLDFPAVVVGIVEGNYVSREQDTKERITNTLFFLERWGATNSNPSIPKSKGVALDKAYTVMDDFISRLMEENEEGTSCQTFPILNEGSFTYEPIETIGANMCGYQLTFTDDRRKKFITKPEKWLTT